MQSEQWKYLVKRSGLEELIRQAGFSEDDVKFMIEDAALQLAWRGRQIAAGRLLGGRSRSQLLEKSEAQMPPLSKHPNMRQNAFEVFVY